MVCRIFSLFFWEYIYLLCTVNFRDMELLKTKDQVTKRFLSEHQTASIGFVPTMGALHRGHISLVEKAKKENEIVVVSIFVNPTQFNDPGDLQRYPRNLEADLKLLEPTGCDFVFAPDVNEIYPEPDTRVFEFGYLSQVMEGKFRPGHFNGVAQVVSKLFDIVKPGKAYFGQKDFQQLAIIKKLAKDFYPSIQIVACPIVREPDGLAMSSRNMLLTVDQRNEAVLISQTLFKAKNLTYHNSVKELAEWVTTEVNKSKWLDVEYFEIVDESTLLPVVAWEDEGTKVGCIAAYCGKIRLIDNIVF
jgi:pantoate--beta-alanine ligase